MLHYRNVDIFFYKNTFLLTKEAEHVRLLLSVG